MSPIADAAPPAGTEVLDGTLVVRHGDDFAHEQAVGHSYSMIHGGQEIALAFAGEPPDDSLSGQTVRLHGSHQGDRFVVAADGTDQPSAPAISTSESTGAKRVAIVLFNFANDTSEPYTPAFVSDVAFTSATSVAAYYAETSWNQLTLSGDVFGWYNIPDTNANCAYASWSSSADAAVTSAGVDLGAYDNVVYAFPSTSCGWAGMASMPGRHSWLNGPGAMNLRVMAHELGHNFGTHHASSLSCTVGGLRVSLSADPADCNAAEYGDPFSVMGMSGQNEHTNFSRSNFSWLKDANTLTVAASGDYTLHPIENFDSAAVQVLRVARTPSSYLTLEYRQPSGSFDDFTATAAIVNGISIRITPSDTVRLQSQLVDTTPDTASFLDASLLAGQTLSDPLSGVSIATMSVTSTGAVVRLSFDPEPSATQTATPAPTPTPTATPTPTSPPTPTPTSSPDVQGPTAPSGLEVTLGKGRKLRVSWGASADDVGVSGYRVFRNGALVATVSATTFSESAGRSRLITYVVVAFDAAGNVSPPSSAVSVAL